MLDLKPLPMEGGFFRETYRSKIRDASRRAASTAIYYMLKPGVVSRIHRLPLDEVYHFYLGDPVEMLLLHPDGRVEKPTLGKDLSAGEKPQFVVPAGVWQGSMLREGGEYALMGTTVAPGFEFSDYVDGDRAELVAEYPGEKDIIEALTGA